MCTSYLRTFLLVVVVSNPYGELWVLLPIVFFLSTIVHNYT